VWKTEWRRTQLSGCPCGHHWEQFAVTGAQERRERKRLLASSCLEGWTQADVSQVALELELYVVWFASECGQRSRSCCMGLTLGQRAPSPVPLLSPGWKKKGHSEASAP
jgi:hypothetical protein